jgi:hypothetical protein
MRGKSDKRKLLPLLLILFLTSGVYFYYETPEWIGGINRFLIRKGPVSLNGLEDLPKKKPISGMVYCVKGIPDYTHIMRQPRDGEVDSCFRVVGFQNKLLVCTRQLETPGSINEILTPQVFTGPLFLLEKTPLGEPLRRGFKRFHSIELPQIAYVLFDGVDTGPSLKKFLLLCISAMVWIFSLSGILKYIRA